MASLGRTEISFYPSVLPTDLAGYPRLRGNSGADNRCRSWLPSTWTESIRVKLSHCRLQA